MIVRIQGPGNIVFLPSRTRVTSYGRLQHEADQLLAARTSSLLLNFTSYFVADQSTPGSPPLSPEVMPRTIVFVLNARVRPRFVSFQYIIRGTFPPSLGSLWASLFGALFPHFRPTALATADFEAPPYTTCGYGALQHTDDTSEWYAHLQPLRNVLLDDTRAGLERPEVNDELVSAQALAPPVQYVVVGVKFGCHVVRVQDC